jgi:hypothetical protein
VKYVFLDSNIYITCAALRRRGHNPSLLGRLVRHAKNNGAILLVPEVVDAEVRRLLHGGTNEQSVTRVLGGKGVQDVALTPEALTRAMLWTIRGDRPARKNTDAWGNRADAIEFSDSMRFRYGVEQDCLILASLAGFMAERPEDELVICTSDAAWRSDGSVAESIAAQFQCNVIAYDDLIVLLKREFAVDVDEEIAAEYAVMAESLAAVQRSLASIAFPSAQTLRDMQESMKSMVLGSGIREAVASLAAFSEAANAKQMADIARSARVVTASIARDLAASQAVLAQLHGTDIGRYVREVNRQSAVVLRWLQAEDSAQGEDEERH